MILILMTMILIIADKIILLQLLHAHDILFTLNYTRIFLYPNFKMILLLLVYLIIWIRAVYRL